MGVLDVLAAPFNALTDVYQNAQYGQGWQDRQKQEADDQARSVARQSMADKLKAIEDQQKLFSAATGLAAGAATPNPGAAGDAGRPLAAGTDQVGPVAPKYDIPDQLLSGLPENLRRPARQAAINQKSDADSAEALKQQAQDRADQLAQSTEDYHQWQISHGRNLEPAQIDNLKARTAKSNRPPASPDDKAVIVPGYTNPDGSPLVVTQGQLKAAAQGGRGLGSAQQKVTGQAASRVAGATVALDLEKHIDSMLSDPETAAQLGPYQGRKVGLEEWYGNPDPKVQELLGSIEGYAMNNQGVHGMRNSQAAKDAVEKMFGPRFSAEDIAAALHGYSGASRSLMNNFGARMGLGGNGGNGGAGGAGVAGGGRKARTKSGVEYTVEGE